MDEESRRPSMSELSEEQAWIEYDRTRQQREQVYEWWCSEHLLDPTDVQSMVEYEMTFEDYDYWVSSGNYGASR